MKPGCQQKLWHEVLKGDKGKRYCLSFRKYKTVETPASPLAIISNAPLAQSTPETDHKTRTIKAQHIHSSPIPILDDPETISEMLPAKTIS